MNRIKVFFQNLWYYFMYCFPTRKYMPPMEIGSIIICKYGKNGQPNDYSQSYSYRCYKPAPCNCEKCKREKIKNG